jgi:mannose-6-phosphate isomerase-like protein (cupin superfamily)
MTTNKRGLSFFPAVDAPLMADTNHSQMSDEQLARLLPASEAIGLGSVTKVLVPEAGPFALVHIWWKPNFPLPRHCHNVDCLYHVTWGSVVMGNRTLRAGDSFFVPAGAPYQYTAGADGAEVLEIRTSGAPADMTVLDTAEAYEQRAREALDANRETWTNTTLSPTMAANVAR